MSRFVTLVLLVCSSLSFEIEAQSLCNSTNAIQNGFKLDANIGCSPYTVIPQDQSGLTDVKYIFDYRGQAATELANLRPGLQDVLFNGANDQPRTYTILQYGKDASGVEKYSCQNLVVRMNNRPFFTASACNNSILQLSIPDTVINEFDYFEVDWGDGTGIERINSLPYLVSKNFNTNQANRLIKVEGKFNSPISCPAAGYLNVDMGKGLNYPNIDELELVGEKKVRLKFTGAANQLYDLYRKEINGSYTFDQPYKKVAPGEYELEMQGQGANCFALFRSFGCMETSGEICTISMDAQALDQKVDHLNWVNHPNNNRVFFGNGIPDGKTLTSQTTLLIEVEDQSQEIIVQGTELDYPNAECDKKVCYQVQSNISGVTRGSDNIPFSGVSLSNKVCIERSKFKPPSINTLSASFEGDSKHNVSFTDDSNWNLNKEQFILFTILNGDTTAVDSSSQVGALQSSIIEGGCYSIGYRDECKSLSVLSPKVCVVKLDVESDVKLVWEANNPFSLESVSGYEIYTKNEDTDVFELLSDRSNAFTELSPDLNNYINEARFKVKILGSSGGVSWTNSKFIPLEFQFFLPDVFTPNGDGKNDLLEFHGSLGRAESLSFEIFDRWGKLLFVSKSKDLSWNATVNGNILPIGQYVYTFTAALKDGSTFQQNGILEILK